MSTNEQSREDSLVTSEYEQGTIIGPRVDPSPFRMLVLAVAGLDEEDLRPEIRSASSTEENDLPDDPDANELDIDENPELVELEGPMPGKRDWPTRQRTPTPADILLSYIADTIPDGYFPANGNFPGTHTQDEKRQLRVALSSAVDEKLSDHPKSKERYKYLQEVYMPGSAAARAMSVGRPQ